jgi:hypothetical protein
MKIGPLWDNAFLSIWHHQNDVVWNDSPSLPNQVRRIAHFAWKDWFDVHHLKHDEKKFCASQY